MRSPVFLRRAAFAHGILVASSSLLVACGGGDDAGSDEDYVKAMCESGDVFTAAIGAAMAAAFDDDEQAATEAFTEALSDWVDAIDDANPPEDAAEAHDALVDSLKQAVEALEDGDADLETAFDDIDDAPEPPQAVQDRLAAIAADTPECTDSDFFS